MKSLLVFLGIIAMIIPVSSYTQIFQIAEANSSSKLDPMPGRGQENSISTEGTEGKAVMDFELYRENMKYYENLFGLRYIEDLYNYNYGDPDKYKKLPEPTDYKVSPEPTEDNDDKNDLEKYCSGKGEWNGEKCVTFNEEEQAAYEDAVCDDPGSNPEFCNGGSGSNDEEEDNVSDDKVTQEPEEEDNKASDRQIKFKDRSIDDKDDNDSDNNESQDDNNDNDSNDNDNNDSDSKDNDNDDDDDNDSGDDDGGDDDGDSGGDGGDDNN